MLTQLNGVEKLGEDIEVIKDSGERTTFSTGAVRDAKKGNGRCDLLPLTEVAYYLGNSSELCEIEHFRHTGSCEFLKNALNNFSKNFPSKEVMLLEVSKHFEAGADKYGEYNWQKGIPVHSYMDSAIRHYLKYRAGWNDERHDRAFVWNVLCCMWTMNTHPELDDFTLPSKKGKENGAKI